MSKVVKQIQEAFSSGNTSTAESLCAKLVGVSDGWYEWLWLLPELWKYVPICTLSQKALSHLQKSTDLHTAVASVEYEDNGTHYVRENPLSAIRTMLVTKLTATGERAN